MESDSDHYGRKNQNTDVGNNRSEKQSLYSKIAEVGKQGRLSP
jgi:hypothetical protein